MFDCGGPLLYNSMMTFWEYVQIREGLWLADKSAAPGMNRLNPFPVTQTRLKRIMAKPYEATEADLVRFPNSSLVHNQFALWPITLPAAWELARLVNHQHFKKEKGG